MAASKEEDISIDLETLGTEYGDMVVAIGACKFDPLKPDKKVSKKQQFYRRIDWLSAERCGMHVSAATVRWWMKQSDEARLEVIEEGIELPQALTDFGKWLGKSTVAVVWGNGIRFDVGMLYGAYKATGLEEPWEFWDEQDVRTIVRAAEKLAGFDKREVPRDGTHHKALDDAIYQAKLVAEAYRALGGG